MNNEIIKLAEKANRLVNKPRKTHEEMIIMTGALLYACESDPSYNEHDLLRGLGFRDENILEIQQEREIWKKSALDFANGRGK